MSLVTATNNRFYISLQILDPVEIFIDKFSMRTRFETFSRDLNFLDTVTFLRLGEQIAKSLEKWRLNQKASMPGDLIPIWCDNLLPL